MVIFVAAQATNITTLFTRVGQADAAVQVEQTARSTADAAQASQITTVQATLGVVETAANDAAIAAAAAQASANTANTAAANAAGIATGKGKVIIQSVAPDVADQLPQNLWIDTTGGANTPKRWTAGAWVIVTDKAATDAANAAVVAKAVADDALAKSIVNAAAVATETTARIDGDSALAGQITTAQSTLNGNIAAAQTTLQTNINTVNGKVTQIGALYTAKLSVNGLVGGFGVYNDGTTVAAGFDVDTFWVGRTSADMIKPFIISGGVTYITNAAIQSITFDKLRAADNSLIFENGKLKVMYLDAAENINVGANATGARIRMINTGIYVYDGVLAAPRVEMGLLL